jgi:ATP-binding cassette subfamily C (CFTR/MRP) protein 1
MYQSIGMAGLAISLALSVTQSLNWSVRMASDLESQMVSVERVTGYANMQQEAAHYTTHDPPPSWPAVGAIDIRNISMRYRPGLPLVIDGVSLSIRAKEKIGIVGRTGSGKSSLVNALLRLIEIESGKIVIDGVDLSTIGLHTLRFVYLSIYIYISIYHNLIPLSIRSNMSIIPQDPVLFSGTIRSNLDPFAQFSDAELWTGLSRCRLLSIYVSIINIYVSIINLYVSIGMLANTITSLDDTVNENGIYLSIYLSNDLSI